jgi:hypothetical protein
MVGDGVRQVRCSACAGEHEYRQGKLPVTRKKKPVLLPPPSDPVAAPLPPGSQDEPQAPGATPSPSEHNARPEAATPVSGHAAQPEPDAPVDEPESPEPGGAVQDGPFHRRLIRATLPRIEGGEPTPRPIPEFTMHKAASTHGPRHGRPFRPGQTGGQHRQGGSPGHGPVRHGGPRHGQGQGNTDGNTFGGRGGKGAHGGPQGPRPSRHGFGPKPPRGPKKP